MNLSHIAGGVLRVATTVILALPFSACDRKGESSINLELIEGAGEAVVWLGQGTGEIHSVSLKSFWMNADGTEGWAVVGATKGEILNYQGGAWKSKEVPAEFVNALWMNSNGSEGWAVGSSGDILHYKGDVWRIDNVASDVIDSSLNALWMNEDGTEGWAGADSGEILHYKGGVWRIDNVASDVIDSSLNALWMKADGTEGWAGAGSGEILRYQGGVWKRDEAASRVTHSYLHGFWMNADGTEGWAVGGNGVILRHQGGAWKRDEAASGIAHRSLFAVWMNADGSEGWAGGEGSEILRYQKGAWKRDEVTSGVTRRSLNALWMNADGSKGWAFGDNGEILYYQGGAWKRDYAASSVTSAELKAVWMNADVTEGWAGSSWSEFLRYQGGIWKRDKAANGATAPGFNALWMNADGTEGWGVCARGMILRYQGGVWKLDQAADGVTTVQLNALWMRADGTEGWAVGDRGEILRYHGGVWKRDEAAGVFSYLNALWMRADGTEGWAVGGNGVILRYQGGVWKRDEAAGDATYGEVKALWMNADGTEGWAVGDSGLVMHYQGGAWKRERTPGDVSYSDLNALWMNADATEGWAVGDGGRIVGITSVPIEPVILTYTSQDQLNQLKGDFKLSGTGKLPIRNVTLSLHQVSGSLPLEVDKHYAISRAGGKSFEMKFLTAGQLLHPKKKAQLRFELEYEGINSPTKRIFATPNFWAYGRPWWDHLIWPAILIPLLNIALVLGAIYWRPLRTWVLHPVGAKVTGLVVGKWVIVDAMIRFIRPIRLGMFRDYRQQLSQNPSIKRWGHEETYIEPQITFGDEKAKYGHGKILQKLIDSPKPCLWLVQGESGLGKTALLENWTKAAIAADQTPFLIRLGAGLGLREELANQMNQWGDVDVTPDVALDLISHGGFLVFLDGFNEDRLPAATRDFVHRISRRNTVVMTSQFQPDLGAITIKQITLHRFGREQLLDLMDERWVDELKQSNHLSYAARLPYTAKLLAEYVERNDSLPVLHVDLYHDLRKRFAREAENDSVGAATINLEAKAWSLFKTNEIYFNSGDDVPEILSNAAQRSWILTKTSAEKGWSFRFRHERIHRFFVALYLDRQDDLPIKDLHAQLTEGLGKRYWADVLEFWSEIHARRACDNPKSMENYKTFLYNVADFDGDLFAHVYGQVARLRQAGVLEVDDELRDVAELILTDLKWILSMNIDC